MQKSSLKYIALSLIVLAGCSTTNLSYDSGNQDALVFYEPIRNLDFTMKPVNLESSKVNGKTISFPAIHRFNGKSLSAKLADGEDRQKTVKIGYKTIPAGYYAITSVINTGLGPGYDGYYATNNQTCREDNAVVIEVKSGQVNLIPSSYLLANYEIEPVTMSDEGSQYLIRTQKILEAYPEITTQVSLAEIVAIVDFGKPTSFDIIVDSCASSKVFKVLQ